MYKWSGNPDHFIFDFMEKTKQIIVNDQKFELHIPTMRSRIQVESAIARSTAGALSLMEMSSSKNTREVIDLLHKVANCNALVVKLGKNDEPDYDFSFFELDEDADDLVDKVYAELQSFIKQYRDGRSQA